MEMEEWVEGFKQIIVFLPVSFYIFMLEDKVPRSIAQMDGMEAEVVPIFHLTMVVQVVELLMSDSEGPL